MALISIIKRYFKKTTNQWIGWFVIASVLALSMGMPWTPTQPAYAANANMILFWDTAYNPLPAGWSIISDGEDDDFLDRYIRGGVSYGVAEGGTSFHTHSIEYVSEGSGGVGVYYDSNKGEPLADSAVHSHGSLLEETVSINMNQPSYRSLQVIQSTDAIDLVTTIPQNAIAIFESVSDYSGDTWATYTSQDTYFLRGGASVGTGGDSSPTHSVTTGLGSTSSLAIINPASTGFFAQPFHSHQPGAGSTSDGGDAGAGIEPPYTKVIFARATADDTTWPGGLIAGFTSTVGVTTASFVLRSESSDSVPGDGIDGTTYYEQFIKGDSADAGTTGGALTHDHANLIVTTGAPNEISLGGQTASNDTYYADETHTHDVLVNFIVANHVPLYWDLILAEYTLEYTPETKNWRWFDAEDVADPDTTNGGDTVTGDAMVAEDTQPGSTSPHTRIVYSKNAFKFRIVIGETANIAGTDVKYWLQFDTTTLFLAPTTVAASGSCGSVAFCYYDGGDDVDDDEDIILTRLSGSPTAGRHNEDSDTGAGAGEGSTFDPNASTDYEHEFTVENNNATADSVYYFRVQYCESSQGASCATKTVALGGGEVDPNVKTSAAYDLEMSLLDSTVSLGSYTKGGGDTLQYPFAGGQEIIAWDKRTTSPGYDITVSAFSMTCSSPSDTIPGTDIKWTSATGTLKGAFASDNETGLTAPGTGDYLDSPVTAYTFSSTNGKGGFFFLPTLDLANLDDREACNFTGTLHITIT